MPNRDNFPALFERLKLNFQVLVPPLIVQDDTAENYYLMTPSSSHYPKGMFFGAVQIKKNYVSYHLMPIYVCTDLLTNISEPLKKRMQGKACFNFTVMDETLLEELAHLTEAGLVRFRQKLLV